MIDTSAVQPSSSIPLGYVLLKTESAKDAGLNIESNGLSLTSQILKCTFVESKPQPNGTNAAVPQAFLSRFGPDKVAAPSGDQDKAIPDDLSGKGDAGDYFE